MIDFLKFILKKSLETLLTPWLSLVSQTGMQFYKFYKIYFYKTNLVCDFLFYLLFSK